MNINHSAEYIALWKSHKRAEWEAVRLRQAADALNHQLAGATGGEKQLPGAAPVAATTVALALAGPNNPAIARQLQQESQRMWVLHSEIAAELERVAASLTPRQRKTAEKMLKQWEQQAKAQNLE